MEERRYREFAKDHWRKSPGAGVIATIEGGQVFFAMKPPEGKEVLHWSVSKRPRGQEGWPLPFSSPKNELMEPQSGEPMQYRFEPVLTSGETVDPYIVEVSAPPVLLNVTSRRNAATVRLLNFDEKTRTATFSVTRYDGGERSEAFKASVGGPLGAIVPDRTGSLEDFRTGYVLAEVERGTQTIATTSTVGLSYTRDSWRAVLRPASHPDAIERVELWKDGAVELQIKLN